MSDLRALFGFHTTPFTREIPPQQHLSFPFFDDALAGLQRCIEAKMSAALIAPAGTGKTALLRRLTAALPEARFYVRYVKVTDLSKRDLCREVAMACGAPPAGSFPGLVRRLQERFEQTLHVDGRRSVLYLDEAQDLRPDALALVRLLTNFEMDSRLVVSLVLCGQPSLKSMLSRDEQEAVARRLHHYATLRLLSREECVQYVTHRCTLAGAHALPFDAAALEAMYEISCGNLRALDGLSLKALERAALAKKNVAGAQHVAEARKDLWP
jgi:type II secretory pathway predicted ATPase ExeA